jgi:GR25 family glycosyltransferase involved in LPS biosynthesis
MCLIIYSYLNNKKIISGFDINKSKYLDGIDKIYWINLDRSTDRKEKMEEMFKDEVFENIEIERISAIDGKSEDIDEILNKNFKIQNKYFTKLEHACLLSHLNTIKLFNESKNDVVLIMEDDMTLEYKPYWKDTVKNIIENAPKDWEIILLCYIYNEKLVDNYTKNGIHNTMVASTGAYLINKKGSNKIMEKYKNKKYDLNTDLSFSADFYLFTELISYTYKYPYFIYPTNNDSEIHSQDLDGHIKSKKLINKYIYNIN